MDRTPLAEESSAANAAAMLSNLHGLLRFSSNCELSRYAAAMLSNLHTLVARFSSNR
jgi:hypothetical protein